MKIYLNKIVQNGTGIKAEIRGKRFRLCFGAGKAKVTPVWYYKLYMYSRVLGAPVTLRHLNIFKLGKYVAGVSLSIARCQTSAR